jgi:hypothetical protein
MTDRFLVSVLVAVSRTFRWKAPFEEQVHAEMGGEAPLDTVHSTLAFLIDTGHLVDSGSELILTIGGKQWLQKHRHLLDKPPGHIEVCTDEDGYTLFTIDGENALAYQAIGGSFHLIPTEEPAQTYTAPSLAGKALCSTLKRLGGNLGEFLTRAGNPFQMPS